MTEVLQSQEPITKPSIYLYFVELIHRSHFTLKIYKLKELSIWVTKEEKGFTTRKEEKKGREKEKRARTTKETKTIT